MKSPKHLTEQNHHCTLYVLPLNQKNQDIKVEKRKEHMVRPDKAAHSHTHDCVILKKYQNVLSSSVI
jgi:hypothetical protein